MLVSITSWLMMHMYYIAAVQYLMCGYPGRVLVVHMKYKQIPKLWHMRAQVCRMSGVSHMKYVCDRLSYVKLTLRMIRSRSVSFSYSYEDLHYTHMID